MTETGTRSRKPFALRELSICLNSGFRLVCHHHRLSAVDYAQNEMVLPEKLAVQAVREAGTSGLKALRLYGSAERIALVTGVLLPEIRAAGLAVRAVSGAQGITPTIVQQIAQVPGCRVSFGLDGADAATHALTQPVGAATFQEICDAVTQFSQAGVAVQIVFTLLPHNHHQIEASIGLAKLLGAQTIRFRFEQPWQSNPAQSKPTAHLLAVEELIAIGRRLERRRRQAGSPGVLYDQPPAFRGLQREMVLDSGEQCDVLHSLAILPSGEYALCALAQEEASLRMGNVGEKSLAQLWENHPILERLRSGLPGALQGICGHCTLRASCQGNCAVNNMLCTGSFFAPDWFCETSARSGLFPASRVEENHW